jgi:hypothetical protein
VCQEYRIVVVQDGPLPSKAEIAIGVDISFAYDYCNGLIAAEMPNSPIMLLQSVKYACDLLGRRFVHTVDANDVGAQLCLERPSSTTASVTS